ncbi:glycosyltransferase [Weissella cibaria]|uniref:glycosyltransferase n=1 Tax=Weissella cibaria TaxID=137591 RepID=UPI00223A98CB|nr:glycosyltransferase [Weissella cibaria]MCT0957837.1 glycosyltransferase [Weissella cibaria]
MVEALANGVPAISYDVKYGPSELIDESTGRLVPEHDYTQMAETLVRWFNTPEELARKSAAAVASTQRFSAENIWQKWNEVLS